GLTRRNLHRHRMKLRIVALRISFKESLELIAARHEMSFLSHVRPYSERVDSTKRKRANYNVTVEADWAKQSNNSEEYCGTRRTQYAMTSDFVTLSQPYLVF